ncbi:hypothetical protein KKC60_01815 [Patescibacteria group bacterium]|nr:hypothetical protein [Patescibacteria group bacterium]
MDNFIFSLQNIAYNINITISALLRHQLIWGFALGFAASTLIHLFVITSNPRMLPTLITKKPAESFASLSTRNKKGTYDVPYSAFKREYDRVRIVLYSVLLAFLVVVIIALVRY